MGDEPTLSGGSENEMREIALEDGQEIVCEVVDPWNAEARTNDEGWTRYCWPAEAGGHVFYLTGGKGLRTALERVALTVPDDRPVKVRVKRTGKKTDTRYSAEVVA